MSFGNVPRDLNLSSLSVFRSTASKSINGFFSANIRTVGALFQYQRVPSEPWVTAESRTVPATQLGNLYTLPAPIKALNLNFDGSTLAVTLLNPAIGSTSLLSVLSNTAGVYSQQAIPLPPDAVGVTNGSASLSDNGKILAFGGGTDNGNIGAVWIYADVAGVWTLQGPKITGPGEIGAGQFGYKLSLSGSGNLLAVSSPFETPAGAAYIFNLSSLSNPTFVARIVGTPINPGSLFGWDVCFSADGSTLAVGASNYFSTNGSVFIFTKFQTQQSQWSQQAYLPSPPGVSIQYFAYNVSLSADGNILAASGNNNAVIYYRQRSGAQSLGAQSLWAQSFASWSSGSLLPLPYDSVGVITQYLAIISQDGNSICTSNINNNGNVGASWIFSQGPPETWTQNGPAFVGTGAINTATQQGYSKISGNGHVAAVQDNTEALLWIFV